MLQFPAFMKQKPSLIAGVIPSSVLLPSQWPQPHNDELLLALEEADLEEKDQHLNVAYESNVSFENEWIFILGVTYHICPKREWFLQYRESHNGGNIVLLNGSVSKAVGRGTIEICMPDGVVRRLGDVLHVPGLCVNVISVPRLCSKGCEVINKLGVMEYNEIRKTNSNVVVIGRTSVDNDKEEFDNDADEEEADNAEETDGDEFEQETG
ncbi:hypothetical protein GIB67_004418 [Kingdonia uniflora]|uniref:Retrovirus-related Pol polyprotein from transposon TNT 1-94-like beta-barrel domain-containing protein n=1 Tax=Kingdonia uniflora TaxID=39325 RepID=A0A7J7MRS9_9MAGN|nr:hypothetical protein GIB67_004418 [Kingdonia uniflora]